ncbi:glucose dehydrogenase [FAD, quinone]-like [Centruroides sculpturatus]|uniref:glucose dehydrogenase [FAD, quinone]-like n=1 Tax=Centruroides sculpturatus TaxID=218467 RepID=UPI000C6D8903|nr:glucose dehydrogenase [FAD, quinone]-like [Centruroides sculpturatus]
MVKFIRLGLIIITHFITSECIFTVNVQKSYDYVIVGGGTAGAVLANRLSSNPSIRVLLLEAGSVPDEASNIPFAALSLQHTELDWSYKSVPQSYSCFGLKENRSSIPRGKGLGGSSVINFMIFVRGNKKDFDQWAENGAEGWSWDEILPYFTKWENNKNPSIASNGYHGVNGEMSVSWTNYYTPLAEAYVKGAKEVGYKEGDYNGPDPEKLRLSVFQILFDSNNRASGVQFEHKNTINEVRVKREVILSAGAINSPQILMLSGIGPKDHLEKFGIKVISNLPVGENLQDHVTVGVPFTVDQPVAFNVFDSVVLGILPFYFGEGPLTSIMVETVGFLSTKYNNHTQWPDIELMFASITPSSDGGIIGRYNYGLTDEVWEDVFKPNVNTSTYLCFPLLMRPESVGTVKLASTDPREYPLINPNYYHKPQDIKVVVEGMKACLAISSSESMRKFGARPFRQLFPACRGYTPYSDEYLECLARSFTLTNYHPSGTCKMGNPRDPTTVVDPQLRVKGVKGLRVVDVSIMPTINSGHTEAPAIMIGEKGADLILSDLR